MMAASMNEVNNPRSKMFIYNLPYKDRRKLCLILDENKKWEELGGDLIKFSVEDLRIFGRKESPTDKLLDRWGEQNHTVQELFVLLYRMKHYQAMKILTPYVELKYHDLIHEGEGNLSRLFKTKQNKENTTSSTSLREVEARALQVTSCGGSSERKLQIASTNLNTVQEPKREAERKIINEERPATITPITNQTLNKSSEQNNNISKEKQQSTDNNSSGGGSISAASMVETYGSIPQIPYSELEVATNKWNRQNILGKGGFGTVYKGLWKNTHVAIKKMENKSSSGSEDAQQISIQQSLGELRYLNSYRHDNVLPLYGYSLDGLSPCLVYQYMPNRSLEDKLLCRGRSPPLLWCERLEIARGVARGIQFLHTIGDKPLIHGDIKSANILLDKNLEPKIGDFGLAREGPEGHYTHMKVSRVHGTRPYLPDEYLRSKKISTKVDTFSFGIVLFEIATGQRAYEETRAVKLLKDMLQDCLDAALLTLMDPRPPYETDRELIFVTLIELGRWCTHKLARERPEVEVVLKQLDELATVRENRRISESKSPRVSPTPFPYDQYFVASRQTYTPQVTFQSHNMRKVSNGSYDVLATVPHYLSVASHDAGRISPQNHYPSRLSPSPNLSYNRHPPSSSSPHDGLFHPPQQYHLGESNNVVGAAGGWAGGAAGGSTSPKLPRGSSPNVMVMQGGDGTEVMMIPQVVDGFNDKPMPPILENSVECVMPFLTELGVKDTENVPPAQDQDFGIPATINEQINTGNENRSSRSVRVLTDIIPENIQPSLFTD